MTPQEAELARLRAIIENTPSGTMPPPAGGPAAIIALAAAARQATRDDEGAAFVLEHLRRTLDFDIGRKKAIQRHKRRAAAANKRVTELEAELKRVREHARQLGSDFAARLAGL